MSAINAIVDSLEKELKGTEQWTALCLNVTNLLHELRSLKTLGNFDIDELLEYRFRDENNYCSTIL